MIRRLSISRRAVLRGMGASVAAHLLDAMVPALTPRAAAATPHRRLGCVYVPHGAIMDRWTPSSTDTGLDVSPILQPLASFRDTLVVVTNLTRPEKGIDTNHAGAPASWLAG